MNADKNEPKLESEISVYQRASAANRNRIDEQIVFKRAEAKEQGLVLVTD